MTKDSPRTRERDREIVRQTAELLSSGVSLSELFERLCALLARFVDASVVFVAIAEPEGIFIEHAYDHGVSRRDMHRRINERSQTMRVMRTGQSILLHSQMDLQGPVIPFHLDARHEDDSNSAIFVPLRFGSRTIGVLSIQTTESSAYGDDEVHLLETCALYLAVAVHADLIQAEKEHFEHAATSDALTRVANRRLFDERMNSEWRRASRDGSPLTLVLLDVDWFKAFNDSYGHLAGDACLKQIASAARACVTRDTDTFARYGGEEFAAILAATDLEGGIAVAERMRLAIAALDIPHVSAPIGIVTASFGVATSTTLNGTPEVLFRTADRALYAAKTGGRNTVVGERLADDSARPVRRTTSGNLRTVTTSFLGRKDELADLMHLLATKQQVTVTGPAGVGKTRTAAIAGQRTLHTFLEGVWMFELSSIREARFLDSFVLTTLGIVERPHMTAREALQTEVRKMNALMIFDNCDHLREAVASLLSDLEGTPGVTLLATSREPLGLANERVFELHPMIAADAVELFETRARAALPAFEIMPHNEELVRRLCERLDRLPLAIELAAPRVKSMTLESIAAGLSERFRGAMAAGSQGEPRPDALRALLEWTFELLDPSAQYLLESLDVFAGSFDGDAVRDICSSAALEPWDVLPVLDELIRKNFVVAERSETRERYRLLEATREFAAERLQKRDDRPALLRRHARYFRAFAQRAAEELEGERVEESLAQVRGEWENIRTGLARALDGLDFSTGRSIVLALRRYWTEAGAWLEGQYWIERALGGEGAADARERVELLYAAALMAHAKGDAVRLERLALELLQLYDALGDVHGTAKAQNALGNAKLALGDGDSAAQLYGSALENYRLAGDRRGVAVALMNLGSLAADMNLDFSGAKRLFEESLAIFRELGTSVNVGVVLANLGEIAGHDGDLESALEYGHESLAIFERLGNQTQAAWQLVNIAHFRALRREFVFSAGALRAAYEKLREHQNVGHLSAYFETWFLVACDVGEWEAAARLGGFLERYRESNHVPRLPSALPWYEPALEQLGRHFPAPDLARRWHEGAALALAEANALTEQVEERVTLNS